MIDFFTKTVNHGYKYKGAEMNDSPWFVAYKNKLRWLILLLLIISLVGPWMFDRISVPAEYTCDLPNVRLNDDLCGLPLSGFRFFGLVVGSFFHMLMLFGLTTGTFINHSRELLVGLLILPFFTTILLLRTKETRRLRIINLVLWVLAFLLSLTDYISQMNEQVIRLWGLWLYILVALGAIIFELFIIKEKPNQE